MRLNVKVFPNSSKDLIEEGDPLVIRVTDSPEKNKANKKVIKLLSAKFGSDVRIVSGLSSRRKVIEV